MTKATSKRKHLIVDMIKIISLRTKQKGIQTSLTMREADPMTCVCCQLDSRMGNRELHMEERASSRTSAYKLSACGRLEEESAEEGILHDWFSKHTLLSLDGPGLEVGAHKHGKLTVLGPNPSHSGANFCRSRDSTIRLSGHCVCLITPIVSCP